MAKPIYVNAKGQRVAEADSGQWREVNAAGEPKGPFADSPFKHGANPQPESSPAARADVPDEIRRVASELESLKAKLNALQESKPDRGQLNRAVEELVSLAKQVGELRVAFGGAEQIEAFVKSVGDLAGQIQELDKRINQVSDKVDATADTLNEAGRGVVDRFKAVEARIKELESRPAETVEPSNPQPHASSPRDDAGQKKEEAMPQTENRTETTSNSQASQPPRGDAGQKEKFMSSFRSNPIAVFGAAAVVAFLGWLVFGFSHAPQKVTTALGTVDNGSAVVAETPAQRDRRFAEIAGATFDQRIQPIDRDLEKLKSKTDGLTSNLSDLGTQVAKVEKSVASGIEKVMAQLEKVVNAKTSSDTDEVEAKRLAQIKAECLPDSETTKGLDLKKDLPEETFQSVLRICRAEKEEKMRQAQTPVGSLPQPQARTLPASVNAADLPEAADDSSFQPQGADASGDAGDGQSAASLGGDDLTGAYDPRTAKAMSPGVAHVAQAGYMGPGGPGFGPGGRGPRGGGVRCPPGMRMTPIGLCGITVMADQRIKDRYNVPPQVAHCRPGEVREFKQPLPNGGMRVVHQTCRR